MGTPWTDEEDAALIDASERGMWPKQISETVLQHRNPGQIAGRAKRLGFGFASGALHYVQERGQCNPIELPDEPHDSLTAFLMGDPTPSRSALARRWDKGHEQGRDLA